MTDAAMTEKDLDLAKRALETSDKGDGDKTASEGDKGASDGKPAAGEGDKGKPEGEKKPGNRSLLDDLGDDDDDEGEPAGKGGDKAKADPADKGKPADGEDKKQSTDDDKSRDADEGADWRDTLTDHILRDQGDKLTANKLGKAREAIMKELQRYKSPEAYMAAGFAARQKIRTGEYKTATPEEGASEAEVKAWRKQNDIPEKPEEYDIPKVEGYTFVEADQPVVDAFKHSAHEAHLSRQQASILIKAHAEAIKAENAKTEESMAAQDREDKEHAADDLRNRFGVSEYKPRMRAMDRLLKDEEMFPDGRGDSVRSARYYDKETGQWRLLINDPYFASLLMQHAEYEFGDVGFTPTQDVAKSQTRISELRELQKKDYNAYMTVGANGKSPSDELLELEQKEEERQTRRGRRSAA